MSSLFEEFDYVYRSCLREIVLRTNEATLRRIVVDILWSINPTQFSTILEPPCDAKLRCSLQKLRTLHEKLSTGGPIVPPLIRDCIVFTSDPQIVPCKEDLLVILNKIRESGKAPANTTSHRPLGIVGSGDPLLGIVLPHTTTPRSGSGSQNGLSIPLNFGLQNGHPVSSPQNGHPVSSTQNGHPVSSKGLPSLGVMRFPDPTLIPRYEPPTRPISMIPPILGKPVVSNGMEQENAPERSADSSPRSPSPTRSAVLQIDLNGEIVSPPRSKVWTFREYKERYGTRGKISKSNIKILNGKFRGHQGRITYWNKNSVRMKLLEKGKQTLADDLTFQFCDSEESSD